VKTLLLISVVGWQCLYKRKRAGINRDMDKAITQYLSLIGRRGGQRSKRVLTREQSLKMIEIREEKKRNLKVKLDVKPQVIDNTVLTATKLNKLN
jgi:hypothetical protein